MCIKCDWTSNGKDGLPVVYVCRLFKILVSCQVWIAQSLMGFLPSTTTRPTEANVSVYGHENKLKPTISDKSGHIPSHLGWLLIIVAVRDDVTDSFGIYGQQAVLLPII